MARGVPDIFPFHLRGVDIGAFLLPLSPIDGLRVKEGPFSSPSNEVVLKLVLVLVLVIPRNP